MKSNTIKNSLLATVAMSHIGCVSICRPQEPVEQKPAEQKPVEQCPHTWIRDPERAEFVYCTLPPKYDWVCTRCGDKKVAADPIEQNLYKLSKCVETQADYEYIQPRQP